MPPWLVEAAKRGVEIGITIAAAYAIDAAVDRYGPGTLTPEAQEKVKGKAKDLTQTGIHRVLENIN